MDFDRLRQLGFNIKCCDLCAHSRFYTKSAQGYCAKHGTNEEPLTILRMGRCRRGFMLDERTLQQRGLTGFRVLAEAKGTKTNG